MMCTWVHADQAKLEAISGKFEKLKDVLEARRQFHVVDGFSTFGQSPSNRLQAHAFLLQSHPHSSLASKRDLTKGVESPIG